MINLGIVTLTLVLASLILLRVRRQELLDDFDDRLENHALVILDSINLAAHDPLDDDFNRLVPFRFPGYFFQLRRVDGRVLETSHNLADRELPLPTDLQDTAGLDRSIATVQLPRGRDGSDGQRLRLLTVLDHDPDERPFYFQLGRSMAAVEASYTALRKLLVLLVPIAIGLSGVVSYLFAAHALAPLRRIVQDTQQLSAENLHTRLAVPTNDDELSELVLTLNDMLERVENAFAAQDRFIANASHELRTPISVIMGATSVLKQQSRTVEEYDRFVSSIEDEARGLANTITSLLLLSRASAGLPPEATAMVSVNDVVMDAVGRCQAQAAQQEVRLVTHLALPEDDDPEVMVRGDAQLLSTMIGNLLRNAIRHSPVERAVEVGIAADGATVQLRVRDHGPGIAPQHVDNIFDRFYSVPQAEQGYQGVGLGLAIVKGVAEVHKGAVRLTNHPEGGCEFVVTLPRAVSAGPADVH